MRDKSSVGQSQVVMDSGLSDGLNGMEGHWGVAYGREQRANIALGYAWSFRSKAENSERDPGLGRS